MTARPVNVRMQEYRARQKARRREAAPEPKLTVTCWCEQGIRHVPVTMIRAGKTMSCGRRECVEAA